MSLLDLEQLDLESQIEELSKQYADAGGWEEFYQKRGNGTMQSFMRSKRLALQGKCHELRASLAEKLTVADFQPDSGNSGKIVAFLNSKN